MNITQESIDDLNALLKVQINQDDYQEKVNAVIQNYRKTASIPGFRKGKVPVGRSKNAWKSDPYRGGKQTHSRRYLQLHYRK